MAANKRAQFLILFIAIMFLIGNYSLKSQETDPFYINLLNKGEKSFLARSYKEAIKELEIAAFGLLEKNTLRAKAYVYISLAYYHLKDLNKSKKYLKDAEELVGERGLRELKTEESIGIEVGNLLNSFQLREIQRQVKGKEKSKKFKPEIKTPEEKKSLISGHVEHIRELKKSIKADPRNIALYYDLYQIYRIINNRAAAKKILKNLVKYNPAEINGYCLLGKMEFKERDYKEAEQIFEKILKLGKRVQLEKNLSVEAKAYLIICSYLQGKRKDTQKMVFAWLNDFTLEKISSLSLEIDDKEMLKRIIEIYKAQAEAEKEKIKIKKLESDIRNDPHNISLYYQLYEIYRKRKESKSAKEILQNLIKNNPKEIKGIFLLAKIEYLQKHYKEALKIFRKSLVISDENYVDRNLVLKSMIYACLCLNHLKLKSNIKIYLKNIYDSASKAEINNLLKEEKLEEEWKKIKTKRSI